MVSGELVACKWVRLACARHLRDLEEAHTRGLWWDPGAVSYVVAFFRGLRHSKGEWAGQPIGLESWQVFLLGSLLGWKRADGMRRFQIAYCEVPRKNGKSTVAAGLGIDLAFFDGEQGAEVYAAATKKDQAKIVWSEAKRMVQRTPALRRRITPLVANLHAEASASKFEPLGADSDGLDGLNLHGAIVDELHAHKTRAIWDVLETAMGARRQPLIFAITTSGSNLAGVCYDQHLYAKKVLQGVVTDDTYFAVIYTIDEGDDWTLPASWAKANPNLGVSVKREDLAALASRAAEMPSAKAAFLSKRLNVWVNADAQAIDMDAWARGAMEIDLEQLVEVPCWIGVDLASKSDVAAMLAVFVRGDEIWIRSRFYLPREVVKAQATGRTAHYAGWAESGHLTLTEGDLIDFGVIRRDLGVIATKVAIQEVAYDPYQGTYWSIELRQDGLALVEIPQNVKQLSGPMKTVRDLVHAGKVHHDGNPMMTWMVSNVVAHEDANENIFPRKAAKHLKIDGFSALLNALNRALTYAVEETATPQVFAL